MQEESGNIHIKFHQTDEEVLVDVVTLLEWIQSGRLAPDDMICGDIMTAGQWKMLVDTRVFYSAANAPSDPLAETLYREPSIPLTVGSDERSERSQNLMILSIFLKVAAVLLFLYGITIALLVISGPDTVLSQWVLSLVPCVEMFVLAIITWALGDLIPVLIDIEHNTRGNDPEIPPKKFGEP